MIKNNFVQNKLSKICHIKTGKLDANAAEENGIYPFFTCAKEIFKINTYKFDLEAILLAGNNASGDFNVKIYNGKFNAYQRTYVIYLKDEWKGRVDINLIYLQLELYLIELKTMSQGSNTKFIKVGWVQNIPILYYEDTALQKQLFETLNYRLINGQLMRQAALKQKEAVEALQGALLREIFPYNEGDELPKGWKWEKLEKIFEEVKNQVLPYEEEFKTLPFVGLENVVSHTRLYTDEEYNPPASTCFKFDETNILYGKLRPYLNKVYLPSGKGKSSMELIPLKTKNNFSREFLAAVLQSEAVIGDTVKFSTGGRMPRADLKKLKKLEVAIPFDVSICNELGITVSNKIKEIIDLNKKAINQLEAIEALPAAILREVFELNKN
jgi:type I restriction enzyme S subunit